jgi:hypothetical protein
MIDKPGNLRSLGDLQQRILRYLFEKKEETVTCTGLANTFHIKQPTVAKSVKVLSDTNYLIIQKVGFALNGIKRLLLTDKGIAAAIVVGATFEDAPYRLSSNEVNQSDRYLLHYIKTIVSGYSGPDGNSYLKRGIRYLIENDYFNRKGEIESILGQRKVDTSSDKQIDELKLRIALEYATEIGEPITLKTFVDKYGINADILVNYLDLQRARIDKITGELVAERIVATMV